MAGGWTLAWVSLGITVAFSVLELVLPAPLLRVNVQKAQVAWLLDMPLRYRPAQLSSAIAEIDTYGSGARRLIAKLHVIPDSVFPLAYVTCLASFAVLLWTSRPMVGEAGAAASVTGGIADVIENAGIVWILLRFPALPRGLARATWVLSWVKFAGILGALLVLACRLVVRT